MVKIEIKSDSVTERAFTGKDGSSKKIRLQEAYAFLGGAYPERVEVSLWDRPAFPVGVYTLALTSFLVNRYRNLELKRSLELVPLSAK